jgi:hypothetical protein
VQTHDVAIVALDVPTTAHAGQTARITVHVADRRYPETVQVELQHSLPPGSGVQFGTVGTLTQSIPLQSGNRTTPFEFSYTFTSDDASMGKVTFQAVVTIVGARDANPSDNTMTGLFTRVR